MYRSHLKDKSLIESKEFTKKLEYDQRTQIWKVPSEKVVTMLNNIQDEIEKIKNDENYSFKFFPLGHDPNRPQRHNCFSWAKEKLQDADIVDLGTKTFYDSGFLSIE